MKTSISAPVSCWGRLPRRPCADRTAPVTAVPRDQLRLRRVSRDRVTAIPARLADLLPADHLARLIWDAVARLDLTAFYAPIVVVIGGPGQAATDPQILVALWLYALSQGVTSARRLNDLCVEHLAYIWLCGGVTMNYHTLSDFRVQHLPALDDLLTQVLACLDQADLIAYEHTAQDGMRVRANAGAASFRREATLEKRLAEARAVVAALTAPPAAEAETDGPQRPRTGRPRTGGDRAGGPPGSGAGGTPGRPSRQTGRRASRRPGLDHGPDGPRHENGGWRLPPGLQLRVRH